MSNKSTQGPITLFSAASMTGTSRINSAVIPVALLDNIGIEVAWTGTPTGTLIVVGCVNNPITNPYNSSTNPIPAQNALTFSPSLTQPTGAAGGYLIDVNQFPYPYIQLQYTNSSGTGALTAYLFSKDLQ